MTSPYFEKFKIRAAEMGPASKVKPEALVNYFQEAAWQHADILGVSVPALMQRGHTWVMHRLHMKILKPIEKHNELEIETWPSDIERLFTFRDFRFTNENKELVVAGATAWVVIDIARRRVIPMPDYIRDGNFAIENGHLPHPVDKLPDLTDTVAGPSFKVFYQHLDQNNHVNNVHYLEWMLASLPQEYLISHELRSIDIQFKSECMLGNEIASEYQQLSEKEFIHRLTEEQTGREVSRAVLQWE